jgi:hypothetical protein
MTRLGEVVAMLQKIKDSLPAAIAGGAITFAVSLGLYYCTRPPPPGPEGEVLSPEAGEQLAPSFTAHGRLDHIPENRHVWVAVQRGELLFPKEPEIPRGDRAWVHEFQEGEAAEVAGDDIAAGESLFSLVLLLVDPDRQAEIETWFAEAEHTGDYPGFEVGAEGFRRLDAVRDLSLLPAEGAIAGEVADADRGQPVDGATVTVDDLEVVTEDDGSFQLEGLDPGCYLLTAASDGFDRAVQVVAVIAGQTTAAEFRLDPLSPGAIAGEVTDAGDGQPIGDATVTASDVQVATDGDGRYQLEELDPGSYPVMVTADGYNDATDTVAVDAGGTTTHNLALTPLPPGAIVGEVTDAGDGQPVGGASVTADDVQVTTNGDGRYQLEELDPGSYPVLVTADGYNDATDTVAVDSGETTTHNLALTPLPPPPTFPLQANEADSPGSVMNRTEASDGTTVLLQDGQTATWVFEPPAAGEYRLVVRYSNDNFGPLETVAVSIDGDLVGEFQAEDTGDYGSGWNIFVNSALLGPYRLEAGEHELTLSVTGGDGYGVEIDHVGSLD